MAQWGRKRCFVYKGNGYVVIPHFDTGYIWSSREGHFDPSAKIDFITMTFCGDETDIAERLTEYCKGMTPDQWERCDPRAILGDAPASEVAAYTATPNQTAASSEVRIIDALVDILVNAGNPEEVRRIAAAALKGLT